MRRFSSLITNPFKVAVTSETPVYKNSKDIPCHAGISFVRQGAEPFRSNVPDLRSPGFLERSARRHFPQLIQGVTQIRMGGY
jgi:hypothetical protein